MNLNYKTIIIYLNKNYKSISFLYMNKLIGVGVSTFVVGALAGKLLFPKKQESS